MMHFIQTAVSLVPLKLKALHLHYDQWIIIVTQMQTNCLITLILLSLLTIFLYWLFYVPLNWTKRLDDASDFHLKNSDLNVLSKNKQLAINRLRKNREIGMKELPPPYPNGWYGVLESSLLKPGQSEYISALGQHFVVYRTQVGEVFILDAYCPHLGANLGLGGRVVGNNIVCPFHQWSFRGTDGACTNIPYSSCVPPAIKIKKWIAREANGVIFVWYHAEDSEEPWTLPMSKGIQDNKMIYHGRNEFYVNCHIQEIPENGADMAHFNAIHNKSFIAGGFDPKDSFLSDMARHEWEASWNPTKQKHVAVVEINHFIVLFKKLKFFKFEVTGTQYGPSYVHLFLHSPIFGDLEVFQHVLPVEPLLQKVVHRFYSPRATAPIMKIILCGESVMFERDMNIWNHKVYRSNPLLVLEETPLKKFRKWYSSFYTANSKPFHQLDDMSW